MLEPATIYKYQATGTDGEHPGSIYKKLAAQYGTVGADTIATAARTGDEKAVFDAEQKLKPGYTAPGPVTKKKFNWLLLAGAGFSIAGLIYFLTRRKKK